VDKWSVDLKAEGETVTIKADRLVIDDGTAVFYEGKEEVKRIDHGDWATVTKL
jgi:hypothetical protein